jgi:excisionase family DNA binding protein
MTTFMVAETLGVSPPTVVNWVNSGLLPAHRTPGGHRRITREDLRAFALQHEYPLPAAFDDDVPLEELKAPTPERGVSTRVLVVDDALDFCSLVREFLVFRGRYEVEVADSGFAAGYAVAQFKPDIILMDIDMPGMDGFEAMRRLQADVETRAIPVIACTAFLDPRTVDRIQRGAFAGHLSKPLRLERLAELVDRVVSGKGSRG